MALLALAVLVAAPSALAAAPAAGDFVPGEALVRFEPGTVADERRVARGAAGVEFEESLELPRTQLVRVDGDVAAAVRRLERSPDVASPSPTTATTHWGPTPSSATSGGSRTTSNPAADVNALPAWARTRGAGQVIAVVDTGVDLTHPDLLPNLWTGAGGIHGHDFVDGDDNPDDHEFHGTHVAGTAAAVADNDLGVAGVAPQAQIMAVRVLDATGSGFSSDVADGIVFAAQNGADVINLSLGGPGSDPVGSAAVDVANANDAVVVAAAGNSGLNNDVVPHTPCTFTQPNLICVAAVGAERHAGFVLQLRRHDGGRGRARRGDPQHQDRLGRADLQRRLRERPRQLERRPAPVRDHDGRGERGHGVAGRQPRRQLREQRRRAGRNR